MCVANIFQNQRISHLFCKTKNKISFDDRRLKEISQAEKLREDAKDIALEAQARRNEEIKKNKNSDSAYI